MNPARALSRELPPPELARSFLEEARAFRANVLGPPHGLTLPEKG